MVDRNGTLSRTLDEVVLAGRLRQWDLLHTPPSVSITTPDPISGWESVLFGPDAPERFAYHECLTPLAGGGEGYGGPGSVCNRSYILTAVRIDPKEFGQPWEVLFQDTYLRATMLEFFCELGQESRLADQLGNNMHLLRYRANVDLPTTWQEMYDGALACDPLDTVEYLVPVGTVSEDGAPAFDYATQSRPLYWNIGAALQNAYDDFFLLQGCEPDSVTFYFYPDSKLPVVHPPATEPAYIFEEFSYAGPAYDQINGVAFTPPELVSIKAPYARLRNEAPPCYLDGTPGGGWLEEVTLVARAKRTAKGLLVTPVAPVDLTATATVLIRGSGISDPVVVTLAANSIFSEGTLAKVLDDLILTGRIGVTRKGTLTQDVVVYLLGRGNHINPGSLTVNLQDVTLSALILPPPPIEKESPFLDAINKRIFVGDTDATFRSSS